MFHKNLRLTSSRFPANKGGLYDDDLTYAISKSCMVGIDSVPGLLPIAHGLLRCPRGTVLSGHLCFFVFLVFAGVGAVGVFGK